MPHDDLKLLFLNGGALLGGMLIVLKLDGEGPKNVDCTEAEVVPRGEFGGETPGGATSVWIWRSPEIPGETGVGKTRRLVAR